MSRPSQERMRELLEQQIAQLGELRTANTRDPNFKEWRQSTLTLIQRLWSSEPSRSERFRRVPFSPPSSKTTPEAMREIYERGCAEAGALLKAMLAEIDQGGVPQAGAAPAPPPPALQAEDDFPLLELPGEGEAPATHAQPPMASTMPVVQAMPVAPPPPERPTIPHHSPLDPADEAFSPLPPIELPTVMATPLPPERPPVVSAPPPVMPPAPVIPPPPPQAPRPRGKRPSVTRALKDMLGFGDPHPAPARPEPPMGKVTVGAPGAPGAKKPAARPAPPRPAPPPETGRVVIQQPAPPPDEPGRIDAEEAAQATEEFFRTSPVLASHARPVQRPEPPAAPPAPAGAPAAPRTPAAASLVALAGEVAHLGVPDGQRAVVRAMLLEMAQQLDEEALSWATLRRAMGFIMEHPPLARRVVPLLIPYLDRAA